MKKQIFKNKNTWSVVPLAWMLVGLLLSGCNIAYDTEAVSLAGDGIDAAPDSNANLDMASLPDAPIVNDGGCIPESDLDFCARLGAQCGFAIGQDNCDVRRTEFNCGTCGQGAFCHIDMCRERNCKSGEDEDDDGLVDCEDDDCLNRRCAAGNDRCQPGGECR